MRSGQQIFARAQVIQIEKLLGREAGGDAFEGLGLGLVDLEEASADDKAASTVQANSERRQARRLPRSGGSRRAGRFGCGLRP